jgi:hypothetical protein
MNNWKGCGMKWSWEIGSKHLPGGTEENHKKASQCSRCTGRDFKPGIPEYEAEMLTIPLPLWYETVLLVC